MNRINLGPSTNPHPRLLDPTNSGSPPARRYPRYWGPAGVGLVALAFLCLVLAACSDDGDPSPTATSVDTTTPTAEGPASSTPPRETSTPRPLPGVTFPSDRSQTIAELIARTAALRGLEPKGDFDKRLIGRQDAADYLEETLDPGDRDVIGRHQEVYRLLGLIPDNADLIELQISLLRGLVLGFYDPDVKALFVLQDLGLDSTVTRVTVVHEVVHALQDQYYDLGALDLRLRDNWDAYMAYVDVVEGDARGVESEFISPSAAANPAFNCNDSSFNVNANSNVPVVIQRELQAPYSDGRCLIATVADRLPEGVDSVFKALPRSTEQVLHPEKYLAGEEPKQVSLPPLQVKLGTGWRETASSTFGEFALQNLLLLGNTDPGSVKRGAAGWGGDGWKLYGREDGARLIHLATAWDSEAEAGEFWEVFLRSLNARSRGNVSAAVSQRSVTWQSAGKTLRAAIAGDRVTIIMSTDPGAAQTAAAELGLG